MQCIIVTAITVNHSMIYVIIVMVLVRLGGITILGGTHILTTIGQSHTQTTLDRKEVMTGFYNKDNDIESFDPYFTYSPEFNYYNAPPISHIKGNLYMGECPEGVLDSRFKAVVNLYPWGHYRVSAGTESLKYEMMDSAHIPDDEVLIGIADWAREKMKEGPVLVHCQAGLNRSGLITAIILMMDGMSAEQAIRLIRANRTDVALCNNAFVGWLVRDAAKAISATAVAS